jgi:hypothetical protein
MEQVSRIWFTPQQRAELPVPHGFGPGALKEDRVVY